MLPDAGLSWEASSGDVTNGYGPEEYLIRRRKSAFTKSAPTPSRPTAQQPERAIEPDHPRLP